MKSNKTIVRLSTNTYASKRGVVCERRIELLKRKSLGFSALEHFKENDPAEEWALITNIDECKDGVYELRITNAFIDCESNQIDDWDYTLVPA